MKKNEKMELKKLSAQELATRADALRRELFSVRLNAATKPVKDKMYFKKQRKDIARVLTLLREKMIVS